MELQSQRGVVSSLVVFQQPTAASPRLDGLELERELQRAAILSLDQIKAIRSTNEYTEGPSVARRPAAPRTPPRPDKHERTHEVIPVNVNNNDYEQRRSAGQLYGVRAPGLSRSTSTGSAASSGSNSSTSSEQGLLSRSPPAHLHRHHPHHHHLHHPQQPQRPDRPVRTQPKAAPSQQPLLLQTEPLKPKQHPPQLLPLPPSLPAKGEPSGHQFICERCGKCKCGECTAPRALPSCLACDGQCLCSAESALEHGTCMCLVKGIFYHCSNDDEGDSCADQPCSLSRGHCGARFLCMGLMAAFFPCLLCYPPVKACVKACQGCHDRLHRPGCRCKNSNTVYCKLESWSPPVPGKPS